MRDLKEHLLARCEPEPNSGCWLWTTGLIKAGYGTLYWEGTTLRAHRMSYEVFVGPIPDGLFICHSCDNRACINPDHLWPGTHRDNIDDKIRKGRAPTKIPHAQGVAMRDMARFASVSQVARAFGVSQGTAHDVIRCKWSSLEETPKFVDGRQRLSDEDVRFIRRMRGKLSHRQLARLVGTSATHVYRIQHRKYRADVPDDAALREMGGA